MVCQDLKYLSFTNIQKLHKSLLNSKVSKKIRNQGETLFCWAFSISTMLGQSLHSFISQQNGTSFNVDEALKKLKGVAVDKNDVPPYMTYVRKLAASVKEIKKETRNFKEDLRKINVLSDFI